MTHLRLCSCVAIVPLLLAVGCGEPTDPRALAVRKQFMLAAAPEGQMTVSKIRKALAESEDPATAVTEMDVVIRGKINAGDLPPWESGKTAFVLTDATGHSDEQDHDPHTCPYCSENINDYLVQVSFLDESGKLFDIDSRDAFDVAENQLLLIQGRATLGDDDLLKVDATGLYIVKPSESKSASVAQGMSNVGTH